MVLNLSKAFFILALVLILVALLLVVTGDTDQKLRLMLFYGGFASFVAGYVFGP